MDYRSAKESDIEAISNVLQALVKAGMRSAPADQSFVRTNYVVSPEKIFCTVAEEEGVILGFQILKLATENNKYGVFAGWGIIGTHVTPSAARNGIGKGLFSMTLIAAKNAELKKIDATIGDQNVDGLAYYASMGFETYRTSKDRICKVYSVG